MKKLLYLSLASLFLLGGVGITGCSSSNISADTEVSISKEDNTITIMQNKETNLSKIIVAIYGKEAKIKNLNCISGNAKIAENSDKYYITCHAKSLFSFDLIVNGKTETKQLTVYVQE